MFILLMSFYIACVFILTYICDNLISVLDLECLCPIFGLPRNREEEAL
jgi:hypothetical protein